MLFDAPRTIPLPGGACPPADDPEAILLWIWQQHVRSGRIERHGEHRDPFWRRVEEKQTDRHRLVDEITASADLTERIEQLARLFQLTLDGLSRDERIATVVRACVPLRFHISGDLENLGQAVRAAEVLRSIGEVRCSAYSTTASTDKAVCCRDEALSASRSRM